MALIGFPSRSKNLPAGVRVDKKGLYYLDYKDPGGRRKREWIGPNKRLALQVIGKRRLEIAEGRFLDRKVTQRVTFRQYAQEYLEVYSVRKRSVDRDHSTFRILIPVFGDLLLDAITPEQIHRHQTARLEAGLKPASINRELAVMKAAFNKAIAAGKCTQNPVCGVKSLIENNMRCRILKAGEQERLRGELDPLLLRLYDFGCYTGMRKGEINLQWKDVDLNRRFLRVVTAKSGEGRNVQLNQTALAVLLDSKPQGIGGNLVFVRPPKEGQENTDGGRIRDIDSGWTAAVKRAGITDYHFHDSRHEFASHLAMRGASLNDIRVLLGHKTMEMVMRYAHLTQSHLSSTVALLDDRNDTRDDTSGYQDSGDGLNILKHNRIA